MQTNEKESSDVYTRFLFRKNKHRKKTKKLRGFSVQSFRPFSISKIQV